MSFEFPDAGTVVVKSNSEKGQLKSITDSVAYHAVGTKMYDRLKNRTYVYVKNTVGASLTTDKPYIITQAYTTASDHYGVETIADDSNAAWRKYVCVPCAALTTANPYGWVQVQGKVAGLDLSATAVFDNEDWGTDGATLEIDVTTINTGAVQTTGTGLEDTVFAITVSTQASDSQLTNGTIYLLGREVYALST